MVNRFMRIIVFFDLPTKTREMRKEYTRFRKALINDGFDMIQFSVYGRTTRNFDDALKHIKHISRYLPPDGSVRAMTVTEKQYASMQLLVGKRTRSENLLDTKDIIEV